MIALLLLRELTHERTQLTHERTRLRALRQSHLAQQNVDEQPGLALHMVTEAALADHQPEMNDVLYEILDACWEEHMLPFSQHAAGSHPGIGITRDDRYLMRGLHNGLAEVVDLDGEPSVRTIRHAAGGWVTVASAAEGALLTGGADGAVRCFDVASGECRRTWSLHAPSFTRDMAIPLLAVTRDGQRAASCGNDGLVAVFSVAGGEPVFCRGHVGGVNLAVFDPTGKLIATMGGKDIYMREGDRTVRIFDADSGRLLRTLGPFTKSGRAESRVPHWVSWSNDGTRVAIAFQDGVECRDAAMGAVLAEMPSRSVVRWVAFAPGDEHVVLGSAAGLTVHDARTWLCVASHADFQGRSPYRGEFSSDGKRLAIIAWDDTARIYDVHTWQLLQKFRGVVTRPLALCWNHAGTKLYTQGGAMQSWYAGNRPFMHVLRAGVAAIASVEFSPDGELVLAASSNGEVRTWDVAKCAVRSTLRAGVALRAARYSPSGEHILLLAESAAPMLADEHHLLRPLGTTAASQGWWLPDGRILLAGVDGTVRVHEPQTGVAVNTIPCHQGEIVCAELDQRHLLLATGGGDRRFCVVDLASGKKLYESPQWRSGTIGDRENVLGLAFAPDGKHVYASCEDQHLRSVDLANGFASQERRVGATPGRLLASPDGDHLLVAAQWSGNVYRFAARDFAENGYASVRHANLVVALQRHPAGLLALTASRDGTVALFDTSRDQLLGVIHVARCALVDARFSLDGSRVVTADEEGNVRVWPVDPLAMALRVRPARGDRTLRER